MKGIILAATEAGWDVRRRMSQITTVCQQLITSCLLNILDVHKNQHFVIIAKKHGDTTGCKNNSLPAVKDTENHRVITYYYY